MSAITESDFHKHLHKDVGSPIRKFTTVGHGKRKKPQSVSKEHKCLWAASTIDLKNKRITVSVFINFDTSALTTSEANRLINLAKMGIGDYWSRKITIDGNIFPVQINVFDRKVNTVDVNLNIETSSKYARSHNSGIVSALFIYNKGFYAGNQGRADSDFKLVSAHEFGHSVLEYFGGRKLSWGHKGSTNALLQNVKKSTPGYPASGEIDLMKYYDANKNRLSSSAIHSRTIASEQDVKRLIWMSSPTFKK